MKATGRGPLDGVRVLEVGGLGPGPFGGMILAEMGADVIRVERPDTPGTFAGDDPTKDLLNRGKRSIGLDLRQPRDVETVLAMVRSSDVLIEGFRPGVMERLGLGPAECRRENPRLVYGRMTGWGQDGPSAARAAHDIDFLAVTGALHAIGDAGGPPQIPLTLAGDFGGGGTYLVMGVLAALWEAGRTGEGRVVDAAVVDGAAHLLTCTHALVNSGEWADERGVNLLDGGAPFYAVYETLDGEHMAVGAIEPKFYRLLLDELGLHDIDPAEQNVRTSWPATRTAIAAVFLGRTRAEWTARFDPIDACVAPVTGLRDAAANPHLAHRGSVVLRDGVLQAAPAPRFSGVPVVIPSPPPVPGQHTREILAEFGLDTAAAPEAERLQ